MIRLTEIRLPLEHPEPALRAAVLARLGIADAALRAMTVFKRGHDARKRAAIVLRLHRRLRGRRRGRGARRASPATRTSAPRPTPATASSPRRRPTSPPARRRGRWSSASAPAASSPRWCWRRWACARSSSSAARRCASAPGTPGACGASGVLDPESNVQFGEGGAGTFSDGKLWSQISDPRHLDAQGARRVRQGRRARGDPLRRQAAHRHLPPGRRGREDARRDRGASAARSASAAASSTCGSRPAAVRGLTSSRPGAARRRASSRADQVVLALGHSARDTFAMLHERGVFDARPSRSRSAFASSIRRR